MPLRSLRERQEHDRTVFLFLQRNQKKKRTEILAFGVVFGMLPLAFANGLKNGVRLVIADVTRLRFTPDSMTDRTLIFENVGGVCLRSASVGQAVVVSRSVALFQQETDISSAGATVLCGDSVASELACGWWWSLRIVYTTQHHLCLVRTRAATGTA